MERQRVGSEAGGRGGQTNKRDGTALIVLREPIHEQILPRLRRDIITHRWKPGARLPEPLICREFGISRTPLRQALTSLEAEGLVRLVPNVGAIVAEIDREQVANYMGTLTALESWAAYELARQGPTEAVELIRSLFDQMHAAAAAHDSERYYALNDSFHRAIVDGSGNRVLGAFHEQVMNHIERERRRTNVRATLRADAAESHAEIIAAIVERDPDAACTAMRRHLERITELMIAIW